jgi:hypothetical protein
MLCQAEYRAVTELPHRCEKLESNRSKSAPPYACPSQKRDTAASSITIRRDPTRNRTLSGQLTKSEEVVTWLTLPGANPMRVFLHKTSLFDSGAAIASVRKIDSQRK